MSLLSVPVAPVEAYLSTTPYLSENIVRVLCAWICLYCQYKRESYLEVDKKNGTIPWVCRQLLCVISQRLGHELWQGGQLWLLAEGLSAVLYARLCFYLVYHTIWTNCTDSSLWAETVAHLQYCTLTEQHRQSVERAEQTVFQASRLPRATYAMSLKTPPSPDPPSNRVPTRANFLPPLLSRGINSGDCGSERCPVL